MIDYEQLYVPAMRTQDDLMMKRLFLLTIPALLLLSVLSAFGLRTDQDEAIISQVREIVLAPDLQTVWNKEEIPASVFELLNKRLKKEYKGDDYAFTLLNGNELVPGTKRVGTNRVAYRKLNFAYTVGEQWIISYYHNNGKVGFQQILIVDVAKKRNNVASLLIDHRPTSPQNLLSWMEQQEELEITYPTESEPDFLIF